MGIPRKNCSASVRICAVLCILHLLPVYFRPVFVLITLVQLFVFVGQLDLASLDEKQIKRYCFHIQDITFTYRDIGIFTNFQWTGLSPAQDLSCIQCNGSQSLFFAETIGTYSSTGDWESQVALTGIAVFIVIANSTPAFCKTAGVFE